MLPLSDCFFKLSSSFNNIGRHPYGWTGEVRRIGRLLPVEMAQHRGLKLHSGRYSNADVTFSDYTFPL
jgi:hypothetical protein